MKKQFLVLLLLFTFTTSLSATQSVHVRIVFPFNPTNVVLHLWGSYSQNFAMSVSGTNEYSITIPGINQYMLFNVSYDLPEYDITNWWIGAGNEYRNEKVPERFDAHGLKFGKIYINHQLINNAFTIENGYDTGLNISVRINDDNTIEPYKIVGVKHLLIDDRIPAEVHHRYSYVNTQFPQPNHIRIAGWLQAITDNNLIGESKIEVDFIRVYGRNGNDSSLLVSHEYDNYNPTMDGGLYLRYPFFPLGFDQHTPMPGSVKNGILTFYPSDVRDSIWHWWSHWQDLPTEFDFESFKLIARIRIIGHALVQGGIDLRDSENNTNELGVTDWYFENSGEWQEVIFDTGDFTITTDQAVVDAGNSPVLQLVAHEKGCLIKYSGLAPGDYWFNLYDLKGQLLLTKQLYINDGIGSKLIKFAISSQHQLILFDLKNKHGIRFKGKHILCI